MKNTIQIAFRYGLLHSFLDAIVCVFTLSKFSHAEIIVDGKWYSSTMKEGVRDTTRQTRKGKWQIWTIKASGSEIIDLLHYYKVNKGQKWDWLNVAFWLLTKANIFNNEYYCFEYVDSALRFAFIHDTGYGGYYKPTAKTLMLGIEKHLKDRIINIETVRI